MLHLIAVRRWNFYRAVWIMDHAGLLLTEHEAQATSGEEITTGAHRKPHLSIYIVG